MPQVLCCVSVEYVHMGESTDVMDRGVRDRAWFRAYNERVEPYNRAYSWVDPPMPDWVCECALECSQPVRMTIEEYEAVRAQPTHFLVSPHPDHVVDTTERVVARHDRYWIVEKRDAVPDRDVSKLDELAHIPSNELGSEGGRDRSNGRKGEGS